MSDVLAWVALGGVLAWVALVAWLILEEMSGQ